MSNLNGQEIPLPSDSSKESKNSQFSIKYIHFIPSVTALSLLVTVTAAALSLLVTVTAAELSLLVTVTDDKLKPKLLLFHFILSLFIIIFFCDLSYHSTVNKSHF